MALAKLKQVAAERDAAVKEMREMTDQCKSIATEFETMAAQYEKILKGKLLLICYHAVEKFEGGNFSLQI